MKFIMQKKQNQLIQRISDQHLVVGIDIAQQTRFARSVNFRGIVLGNPISFGNHEEGFNRLLQAINKLLNEHIFLVQRVLFLNNQRLLIFVLM